MTPSPDGELECRFWNLNVGEPQVRHGENAARAAALNARGPFKQRTIHDCLASAVRWNFVLANECSTSARAS